MAWPELGIWEEIQPKTTRVVTERVASVVARGEAEIGFQAMSEILPIEGAELAGLLPDELQQVATVLVVMTEHMENPEAARKLVEFLSSDAAATVVQSTGLMPVALDDLSSPSTAPPWAVDLNPSRFAWRVARRRTSSSSTDRRSMS